MTKKLLPALIAGLFVSAPALAQYDGWGIVGSGTVGFMYNSTNDTKDASKLEEYRDLSNGVLSNVYVRGRNNDTWFEGYGENFGRDDQYLMLRGGVYDKFKYQIFSDKFTHNFLFNGRTPFSGSGTNVLTATFPQPNPALWNDVDIGYKRSNDGGYFEWQGLAPWYVRVDANQVKWQGTKIGSGANGTSPGNGFTDLAIPVQYNTRNITGEAGYNTGTMNLSLSYLYSKFDNDNGILFWSNPFFANIGDQTFLPPDNHYQRIAAQGTFRGLPGQSTFALRATWAEAKSDADLAATALNGAAPNFVVPTQVNTSKFTGKNRDDTFTASLASHPLMNVDTRIYYNYYKRNNDSTDVVYPATSGVNCGGEACEATLLHFTKNNFGLDGYWRFVPNNRLGAGWDWEKLEHNRIDYDNIETNRFFVEWKNTSLPNLSGRIKYTYLQRRSDFLFGDEGANANDPAFLNRFTSAFDSSNLDRNQVKITADWSPMPMLDFSLEYNYTENKYKDITLGRTKDTRDSIYVSGGWGDVNSLRLNAFGDWEQIKYDSFHRNVGAGSCPTTSGGVTATNCFDPSTPPNSIAYNWKATTKDRNWVVGAGLDWHATDRLLVKGSILYYETDGSADMQSQNAAGEFGSGAAFFGNPLPVSAFDDTKRTSVNLKGIWSYDKNWDFTLGYAYERWRYSDAAYNGYQYTVPFPGVSNNASQSYLNGFNAFTNYEANIVYLLATYHFDTLKH